MKLRQGCRRACRMTFAVCAVLQWGMTAGAHAATTTAASSGTVGKAGDAPYVLLRFAAEAGSQVGSDERREALTQALIASASAAHVLICRHGVAAAGGPSFDRMCSEPNRAIPELWWDAAIAIHRAGETTVTCSLQLALGDRAPKAAPAFFLTPPITLPADLGAASVEGAALREVSAEIAANPYLVAWFRQVAKLPGPTGAKAAETPPAAPPAAAERPAREPAVAATKAAGAGSGKAPPPPPQAETSFTVRQAVIGEGFGGGADGYLRIGSEGVAFSRKEQGPAEWTIRWKDLASASQNDGIWDAPFVIALVEKGGRVRYLTRTDGRGHYLAGDAVLAAITHRRESPPKTDSSEDGVQK